MIKSVGDWTIKHTGQSDPSHYARGIARHGYNKEAVQMRFGPKMSPGIVGWTLDVVIEVSRGGKESLMILDIYLLRAWMIRRVRKTIGLR